MKDLSGDVGLVLASLIPRVFLVVVALMVLLIGEFFLEVRLDSHLVLGYWLFK
jgi:hypothetical protein